LIIKLRTAKALGLTIAVAGAASGRGDSVISRSCVSQCGHNQSSRRVPQSSRSPATAGHER
jgi:hypothetical protein